MDTVHVLLQGASLCGLFKKLPERAMPRHRFVSAESVVRERTIRRSVNCAGCLGVLAEAERSRAHRAA